VHWDGKAFQWRYLAKVARQFRLLGEVHAHSMDDEQGRKWPEIDRQRAQGNSAAQWTIWV
jgi:hypothetical protein